MVRIVREKESKGIKEEEGGGREFLVQLFAICLVKLLLQNYQENSWDSRVEEIRS